MSLENSSLRSTRSSAARNSISARLGAGTSRQDLYASFAASAAASASSAVEDANMPINSSVLAGLRFSYAFPLRDSTHSPLMKFLNIRGATAVAILPPRYLTPADLFFAVSLSGVNANHNRVEAKFYSCSQAASNLALLSSFRPPLTRRRRVLKGLLREFGLVGLDHENDRFPFDRIRPGLTNILL